MGKLYVVGIGPGNYENMTIRADRILGSCEVIAGYSVYVDLVKEHYPGKEYFTTPMTKEADRCRQALLMAEEGKDVALICSGDSGIYGMAALVYELRGDRTDPEIEVIPGITAASSAAALLGAPLTHDFSVISLSDRLTDWDVIKRRLEHAAYSDMTIVLYNPSSKGRPMHLKNACEVLLGLIPGGRICGVARNVGREGESFKVMTLNELKEYKADMFCTVFIGSGKTMITSEKMVTPRGYHGI